LPSGHKLLAFIELREARLAIRVTGMRRTTCATAFSTALSGRRKNARPSMVALPSLWMKAAAFGSKAGSWARASVAAIALALRGTKRAKRERMRGQ